MNNIFKQNTLKAIVLKLQAIYSTVITSKYLLLGYAISYRSAIFNYVIADPKVGEQHI